MECVSFRGGILLFIVLVDAFLTGCGVNAGHLVEFNPSAAWFLTYGGPFLFILFRAMFVLLVVANFDRKLKGDEASRRMVTRSYNVAILFYAGYFVLPWLAVNHEYILASLR